ncbi:LacI family DNA-binding transcriptional regulator [Streptomyces hainanensis]|uniref:LacI family transcriptional regulator n=1 Tax=Streptomyces hainanensis TaxID=402648 RepID=A0A4R4TRR1_9ACTN|nr:LacI family DNA-binding transcriptional regulator [Streptomyces hainanensis]TDC76809.1 LacI family transcriptional regulator [Streptomyces hainanensis]
MTGPRRRVTQQDIARICGVSQTTVSLVLNNRLDAGVRIASETRERVLEAIAETGYVADPVARRMVARRNRIIGVFTYEAVFPSGTRDFYQPFLAGIEDSAEQLGCDLLLLTSAPVVEGRRRIFHEGNRFRLADGCILLGRETDRGELARLVAEGYPFVSVGRRADTGGPVPYVGADYPGAVAELVAQAVEMGHRRLAYLGSGSHTESRGDRRDGFTAALAATGAAGPVLAGETAELVARLPELVADGVTALFVEDPADCQQLADRLAELGHPVPAAISTVALGDPPPDSVWGYPHPPATADIDFTGFRIPRWEMGRQAMEVLSALLEEKSTEPQRLLRCAGHRGASLAPPPR